MSNCSIWIIYDEFCSYMQSLHVIQISCILPYYTILLLFSLFDDSNYDAGKNINNWTKISHSQSQSQFTIHSIA